MFYLKYRPRTIDELDNSRVKVNLKKILESKNIPHAFLFVGQKGTGKTSAARIVAKSINCEKNVFAKNSSSINPCNACKNCKATDASSSLDVVELDAASNRGIDDIRSLIKESNFLPMSGRFRVFIIDEAHMITPDAFNALLKTLEEPPKSVIFILATTNKEKLPKTIQSRCQVVDFGRAKKEDLILMLKRIVRAEKLDIDDKLLEVVADRADASFRDAAKILEELVVQNKLTLEDGEKFLGVYQQNFLELIESKDLKSALGWINEFAQTGANFKPLIEEFLGQLRVILLQKNGVGGQVDTPSKLSLSQITKLIKLFTEAYQNLKISPIESLPLEIAVVEFYNFRNDNKSK